MNSPPRITILGIGNILFTDEGFGVRVVEQLGSGYEFSENVSILDGGVLGMNLLGLLSETDFLIVIDAIRKGENPGSLYKLEESEIPSRIRAKNSLHQVDFLEALTMCRVLDQCPQTVVLGVEPQDIETLSCELTPLIRTKVAPMIERVLEETVRLGASYRQRE
ncbi:MAG: HyaD/HybD family hydrogenase maturation endopeptidase [Deltaproteobacteria bacterium]|nr:HyaD/HybD family hydrogenase maturation endopeptidase [Deltaproteobacteria bacterium]